MVTFGPGPIIVYALTLNVMLVFGGRSLIVCCVADVKFDIPLLALLMECTPYLTMTPLGSDGGFQNMVT